MLALLYHRLPSFPRCYYDTCGLTISRACPLEADDGTRLTSVDETLSPGSDRYTARSGTAVSGTNEKERNIGER